MLQTMRRMLCLSLLLASWSAAGDLPRALAQQGTSEPVEQPGEPAQPASPTQAAPALTVGGYVEAFWQWNFNRPENGITNHRAFDNRHNTFTLSNLAIDAAWDGSNVLGRLALQVGHTPSTYYAAEPLSRETAGANRSDRELWKYVQQANVGYRFFPLSHELTVLAGIFLSPIGPESMAVRDNWTWSRSNLFFGLPFYHTGVRASLALNRAWNVGAAVYNGWNSVVDGNQEKSVSLSGTFTPSERLALGLLYFGGVERPEGAPEGEPWRHLFDLHLTYQALAQLALIVHANGGLERNTYGTSWWSAGQLLTRVALHPQLSFTVRGDLFREHVAKSSQGEAAALFWPAKWVGEATATLDYHPQTRVSFRLEYRHDVAERNMFYRGAVAEPAAPNARRHNTLTVGLVGGF